MTKFIQIKNYNFKLKVKVNFILLIILNAEPKRQENGFKFKHKCDQLSWNVI